MFTQTSSDVPRGYAVDPYALRTMRTAAKPGPLEFHIGIVVASIYGLQINSAGSDGLIFNPYALVQACFGCSVDSTL